MSLITLLTAITAVCAQVVPTSPYKPVIGACPANAPAVRSASGLSSNEAAWVAARHPKAKASMDAWLQTLNLPAADYNNYKKLNSQKNINLVFSGGGYRALLIGAGTIEALDSRETAALKCATTGFMQGTTYVSALSGGGWLLSSLVGNDWARVSDLETNLWSAAFAQGMQASSNQAAITADIAQKQSETQFMTSINDPWGRMLSYQLLYGSDGGVSKTFSGFQNVAQFADHSMPFPILTALGLGPTDCMAAPNATQYEFTPYEFGSWDAGVKGFVPMQYVGTTFSNGAVSDRTKCVTGYDNAGFVLGTSSLIFSYFAMCPSDQQTTSVPGNPYNINSAIAPGTSSLDAYYPNPFLNLPSSNLVKDQAMLRLVDGGLALQNNPLWPVIQPERNSALILVSDNSADQNNFPNGSEILTTYIQATSRGLKFPVIPPVQTFLDKGLYQRPTLFGCTDKNVPTILWVPNSQHGTYPANQSTTQKTMYTDAESRAMIANGYNNMNQDKSTSWARCLGCFVAYDGNIGSLNPSRPSLTTITTKTSTTTTSRAGRPTICTIAPGKPNTCLRPTLSTATPTPSAAVAMSDEFLAIPPIDVFPIDSCANNEYLAFVPIVNIVGVSCQFYPALDSHGNISDGLLLAGKQDSDCPGIPQSYIRATEIDGWKCYVFAYYLPKFQPSDPPAQTSHRHQFEWIALWLDPEHEQALEPDHFRVFTKDGEQENPSLNNGHLQMQLGYTDYSPEGVYQFISSPTFGGTTQEPLVAWDCMNQLTKDSINFSSWKDAEKKFEVKHPLNDIEFIKIIMHTFPPDQY